MVQAAVRLTPGVVVNAADLIAFVKAEIGSVKAPKVVHFVAELPRNAAGKVSRSAVRVLVSSGTPEGQR
jgi:acyl-coenzyme A synthetase/AMP-(fatty) acid ligase